ncbi:polyserase-2 isoform X2 [Drosophila biarmipes]|uniref:polyserase-2 isoform X2 n=1 Tax=Drosophila biarmipes TaxID=125945 RepID=UPI001CDA7080|nr:polyserase-2 isoform X2 [Drosophila biarmipes]XP_050743170.1 polyserase-2 isoform X2 [Drosophila biarmipes]
MRKQERGFVLTAAHCIIGQKTLQVKLGAFNMKHATAVYNVIKAITHRSYRHNSDYQNDIGLLKLSSSAVYSPYIHPICIILNKDFKTQVVTIPAFKAYGWGRTEHSNQSDILQTIIINREDPAECYKSLVFTLTPNQICGRVSFGDTCDGDSGGPLINNVTISGIGDRAVQLGIVSFGSRGCNGIGVYTDVTSYVDWIEARIKGSLAEDESQAKIPLGPAPGNDGLLYRDCGGATIASNLLANINGPYFTAQGVLITDQFVITNSKGLPANPVFIEVIVMGMLKTYDSYRVANIFKPAQANNDIALIQLSRQVTRTDGLNPVCMLANPNLQQIAEYSPYTVFDYVNTYAGLRTFAFSVFSLSPDVCTYRIQRRIEANELCIETPRGISQRYGKRGDILMKKLVYMGKESFVLFGILSYSYNGVYVYTNVMAQTGFIANTVMGQTVTKRNGYP